MLASHVEFCDAQAGLDKVLCAKISLYAIKRESFGQTKRNKLTLSNRERMSFLPNPVITKVCRCATSKRERARWSLRIVQKL